MELYIITKMVCYVDICYMLFYYHKTIGLDVIDDVQENGTEMITKKIIEQFDCSTYLILLYWYIYTFIPIVTNRQMRQ